MQLWIKWGKPDTFCVLNAVQVSEQHKVVAVDLVGNPGELELRNTSGVNGGRW